jgi:hypothetical protein
MQIYHYKITANSLYPGKTQYYINNTLFSCVGKPGVTSNLHYNTVHITCHPDIHVNTFIGGPMLLCGPLFCGNDSDDRTDGYTFQPVENLIQVFLEGFWVTYAKIFQLKVFPFHFSLLNLF